MCFTHRISQYERKLYANSASRPCVDGDKYYSIFFKILKKPSRAFIFNTTIILINKHKIYGGSPGYMTIAVAFILVLNKISDAHFFFEIMKPICYVKFSN